MDGSVFKFKTKTKTTHNYRQKSQIQNHLEGSGTSFDSNSISWMAHFNEAVETKEKKKKEKTLPAPVAVTYPNNGFGFSQLPQAQNVIFKNATVWTNEAEGILQNTDVWVENGKIKAIGKNLSTAGLEEIDATGKHLTSGVIDEHSHIAASSINEGGHNSSAEVTIEDVINPDDINLYRNLSGGVTTLQILHGSANPMGGGLPLLNLAGENRQMTYCTKAQIPISSLP